MGVHLHGPADRDGEGMPSPYGGNVSPLNVVFFSDGGGRIDDGYRFLGMSHPLVLGQFMLAFFVCLWYLWYI